MRTVLLKVVEGGAQAGRFPGLLSLMLALVLQGCAAPPKPTPPPEPTARRVPVRVAPQPARPERKEPPSRREKEPKDIDLDDRGLERYTQALRKIPATPRTPAKGEKVYPIDLNLRNADLVEAVRVLADTLGLNYSIDPKVKGTVNVRASGKLSQSELMSILQTLLQVNAATLTKSDNLYKIVPLDKAATGALPVLARGVTPEGMRVQVVFLEQTAAKEMIPVLKPLMSAGGNLAEAANNALILVDTPDNLEKLLKLINLIDSRTLAQTLVRLAKVQNTDPSEIIGELETIFAAYGTLAQKGKFGVSFIPVNRLNSIMILANSGPLMERAQYWVRQLDSKTDMLANVHIYQVENYKAKNLANLLTQVYGGTPAAPTVKETRHETAAPALGGSPLGGGAGGLGGTGGLGGAGGLGGKTLVPGAGTGTGVTPPGVIPPGGETTAAGAPLRERAAPGAAGAGGVSPKEGVRIIPDEENNLLVVVAPPHEWNVISRLLKSLDIMPRQVLSEVLIVEVKLTDELKYGVEWFLGNRPASASTVVAGTTDTTGATTTGAIGATSVAAGLEVLTGASAAFSQATGGFVFIAQDVYRNLKGLINVLAAEGKVSILASPHIMAANNQEARIQIGDEVPILTSQSVPMISQATSFQTSTVQYRSTGIILIVKPQINAKGMVTLEISQEVSSAATTATGVSNSPTISVRQAKTSLITGDNQTIVLGGLIREDWTHTQQGIPGLKRVPLLGPLFGSEGKKSEKTELLVLITPHIITNLEEGARITQEMKDKTGVEETTPQQRRGKAPLSTSPGPPTAPRP